MSPTPGPGSLLVCPLTKCFILMGLRLLICEMGANALDDLLPLVVVMLPLCFQSTEIRSCFLLFGKKAAASASCGVMEALPCTGEELSIDWGQVRGACWPPGSWV